MADIFEGINLFNDGDYFAAHDVFEAIWMEEKGESRLFYQGLVQISVACYHLICGNYRGSLNQFKKGTEKLQNYLPVYMNIDLEKLLKEVDHYKTGLNKNIINPDIKITFDQLPKISFVIN